MTTTRIPMWSLGERMAKARSDAGLTQEQMAAALTALGRRAKKQTVSNWENNINQPRDLMVLLEQWAEVTQVPLQWILNVDTLSTR